MSELDDLIARIRHVPRAAAATRQASGALPVSPTSMRFAGLESRVAHVEQLVERLQDSVHTEFERQGRLIAHLKAQLQPAVMRAALNKDTRNRGP